MKPCSGLRWDTAITALWFGLLLSLVLTGLAQALSFESIFNETDETSGQGSSILYHQPANFTRTPTLETWPHLVVNDTEGNPCLLASLNATMEISYRVVEGIAHEKYLALVEVQLPEDVQAQGVCGDNTSLLLLTWSNQSFHVNLTFTRQDHDSGNSTWSLTYLSVSYDLSNKEAFPGSSEATIMTVEGQNLNLFQTPVGSTHYCNSQVSVPIGNVDQGVVFKFHEVKIAAFGVSTTQFPQEVSYCRSQAEQHAQEDMVVPLIVACCLCAMVVIIVIAYVINRKVQLNREQSQYKQMP